MKSPRLNVQWRMRLLLEQSNLSRAKRFEGNWKQNNVVVYSWNRFSRRGLWCKPSLNLAPIDARHEFYRSNSHRCDRFSPVEHLPRISISRHRYIVCMLVPKSRIYIAINYVQFRAKAKPQKPSRINPLSIPEDAGVWIVTLIRRALL